MFNNKFIDTIDSSYFEMNCTEELLNEKVSIHVDYMSFTFPVESNNILESFYDLQEEIAELLYCDKNMFAEARFAQDGYKYQYTLGENIIVRFGGTSTKMKMIIDLENSVKSELLYDSINVELKGEGCREIEKYANYQVDYIKIMKYFIYEKKGRCKRFDIAIDDTTGDVIGMKTVYNHLEKGWFTSCFRKEPTLTGEFAKTIDFNDRSLSIYFGKKGGSHKPGLELCIYNKKAERLFNNDSYEGDYWVRYEQRYRDTKADELVYYFIQNNMNEIGLFACKQLKFILELKYKNKRCKDSNVSRWPVLPAWERFLECVKGSRLSQRAPGVSTIDRKKTWRDFSLTRQNILLGLVDAYSYDDKINYYLDPLIAECVNNLRKQYDYMMTHKISGAELQMMNNYLKEKRAGYLLTENDVYKYMEELNNRIKKFEDDFSLPF